MTDANDQLSDPCHTLSDAGMQRRDEMLHELIADMRRFQQRRRVGRKLAIVSIAPILALVAVGLLWRGSSSPPPLPHTQPANGLVNRPTAPSILSPPTDTSAPIPSTIVLRVQTDPTIVDRWRAAPKSSAVIIDDQALLDMLAALDRPAGLIRSQGHVWMSRPVTDPGNNPQDATPDNSSMNWLQSTPAMDKS